MLKLQCTYPDVFQMFYVFSVIKFIPRLKFNFLSSLVYVETLNIQDAFSSNMHPILVDILLYLVLPLLRYFRVVWQLGVVTVTLILNIANFLTGGVFLTRQPIERKHFKTKTLKLYIESNVFNTPFDEVQALPDVDEEQVVPSRSRTSSTRSSTPTASTSSWMSGERREATIRTTREPFFNVAIQTIEEGNNYLFHG